MSIFSGVKDFPVLHDLGLAAAQRDSAQMALAMTERRLHPWITVAGALITRKELTKTELTQWVLLPPHKLRIMLRTPPPPLITSADRRLARRLAASTLAPAAEDFEALKLIISDLSHDWQHATESRRAAQESIDSLLKIHHHIPDRYIA